MNLGRKTASELEPRLSVVETGLTRLTDDLRELAGIVRQQGSQTEAALKELVIAVTKAGGPRKVDWSVIFTGVFLVITVAGAAFWPLHMKVAYMELRFSELAGANSKAIDGLDKKQQREAELIANEIKTQVSNLNNKYGSEIQNLGDRLVARVNEYDRDVKARTEADLQELRQWRLNHMRGGAKRQ